MNRLNTDAFGKIKRMVALTVPSGSQAILYGSQARGEARPDSDWDVLIVLNKDRLDQSDYDNVCYPFVLLGCELGEEINPILYTKKNGNPITSPLSPWSSGRDVHVKTLGPGGKQILLCMFSRRSIP